MMNEFIAGNVCSLFATISDGVSSSRKTTRSMLLVQVISQVFYCASAIFLKGYSAAVQNGVGILRNLMGIRKKPVQAVEWLLIAIAVGLGLYCNNLGIIGLLPVIANLEYSLTIFLFRGNERLLKIAFLISISLFTVFNFMIMNIVGGITNGVLFMMTLIMLIRNRQQPGRVTPLPVESETEKK